MPRFFQFLILFATALAASGQSFDIQKDRVGLVELDGVWRFQTGDDPRFAQPDFDDSSWQLLKSNQTWAAQGYRAFSGVAWYRFELNFPERIGDPALLLAPFANNEQVYANGRLIGESGPMPPNPQLMNGPSSLLCRIPQDTIASGQPLHIAIRVWQSRLSTGRGGPNGTTLAGSFGQLKSKYDYQIKRRYWSVSALNIQMLISLLAGLAASALFALQPSDREYLWFAAFEFMSAALPGIEVFIAFYRMPSIPYLTLRNSAQTAEWTFFLFLSMHCCGSIGTLYSGWLLPLPSSRSRWTY